MKNGGRKSLNKHQLFPAGKTIREMPLYAISGPQLLGPLSFFCGLKVAVSRLAASNSWLYIFLPREEIMAEIDEQTDHKLLALADARFVGGQQQKKKKRGKGPWRL